MCHESPVAQLMALVIVVTAAIFVAWHIYKFDKGHCLRPNKHDAFRCLIMWMLVIALVFFLVWNSLLVWVKYTEYYTVIPLSASAVEILVTPYQLPAQADHDSHLLLCARHWLGPAALGEETLYWAYLIGAIRARQPRSWFASIQFKIWVASCVTVFAVLLGAVSIETTVITKMEGNIFLAGGLFAVVLFITSLWLVFSFPAFIRESRRQGANPQVLGRLQYFREVNLIRTVFRFVYAGAILALSVDALTERQYLNTTAFWLDTLYIAALFSVVGSSILSLLILLPRSLQAEAGGKPQAAVFVRRGERERGSFTSNKHRSGGGAHHHGPGGSPGAPASEFTDASSSAAPGTPMDADGGDPSPWGTLGGRLNLDKEDVEDLVATQGGDYDLPFAAQPGSHMLRHLSMGMGLDDGYPQHPNVINQFRSPLDVAPHPEPVDLGNIVISTTTVVEKDV